MKKILLFLLLVCPVLAIAQSQDENYILNRTYTQASTTPNGGGISTITYYDGIGRPKQVINLSAGEYLNQHQFTPIIYDDFGRQTKNYLPYAVTGSMTFFPPDYMDNDNLISLINTKYSAELLSTNPNPYSEMILENSPLSRPLEQGAPGKSWLADPTSDNDHTIKYEYDVNKYQEVRRFFVSFPTTNTTEVTSLHTNSYYAASTLYKKVVKDENWTPSDGKNKTTEEFTDKQGRTVLKRTYNDGIPHDTHYVYDKYSNLTYVIPPLAADNVYSFQFSNDFQNVNFPWTHLAAVDGGLADAYERAIGDYDNSEILNLDLLSEYGGQGGFSITPDEEGNLILNVNITTSKPMAYRTGQLLKLDKYGSFKDKELGRLVGNGYEYYFLIQGNALVVDGYGVVPSITQSFTGNTPLEYQKNYPWTKLFKGDTEVVRQYESDIANLPNSDILTTFTANPYNATGGMSVSLDQDDTVNLSINIYSDQALDLLQGAVLPLGFKRSIADRTLGTVTGSGYTYSLEIKNNTLYILGSGTLNHLTFGGSFGKVKTVINPSVVDGLCYIYNYDKRNRLIKKHIPGKGWQTIVYDKLNRPVFTQDEKLRAASGGAPNWMFTKYDKLGRVIYTGEFYDNRSRETLQDYINGLAGDVQHESYQYPGFLHNGITVDYTNDIFPTTGNILTVTNYDTYKITYEGIANNPSQNYYGKALISKPVGLVTATKVRTLKSNKWVTTILGYDEKGRQIWSSSKNAALLSEFVSHQNLNFSGLAVATKTEHTKEATGFTITVEDSFDYDNMNRLEEHRKKINNNPEEMIVHNIYDELGRLKNKRVGGIYNANTNYDFSGGLQKVDYKYNIRGWLTAINNVQDNLASGSINDLFALRLDYD
ncbi:DUF6443 domain-containing protein, partial [Flavobacterium beibuense]|uniref:DUF6443 domain-containing protein n=1 Tax=Flavobacterium beibuense TaxID=657326 RepID=UPI003A8D18AF